MLSRLADGSGNTSNGSFQSRKPNVQLGVVSGNSTAYNRTVGGSCWFVEKLSVKRLHVLRPMHEYRHFPSLGPDRVRRIVIGQCGQGCARS